ncbi:MAG: GH3 family domain-containing protein, partial [Planctomycetota bacterium]
MGIRRTLLKPVAFLAGKHADRQVRAWMGAHERTSEVQQRLLEELIARHAATGFGRDHDFASIRTYADFARAVPVRTYADLRGYMDRVFAGETAALLPSEDEVCMFSRTSGTTGMPKHVPVTRRCLADLRRGWNVFGVKALRDHPTAWLRGICQITSPMREDDSPTGLPCGAVSGLLAATQKRIVRRMYPVPRAVYGIEDPDARYY